MELVGGLEKELHQINGDIARGESALWDMEKDEAVAELEEQLMTAAAEHGRAVSKSYLPDENQSPGESSAENVPTVDNDSAAAQTFEEPAKEYRVPKKARNRNSDFPALLQANPVPKKSNVGKSIA